MRKRLNTSSACPRGFSPRSTTDSGRAASTTKGTGAEVRQEALEFMLGHGPTSTGGLTGEGKTSRAGPYARRPAARRETVHDSTASGERGYKAGEGTGSGFFQCVG